RGPPGDGREEEGERKRQGSADHPTYSGSKSRKPAGSSTATRRDASSLRGETNTTRRTGPDGLLPKYPATPPGVWKSCASPRREQSCRTSSTARASSRTSSAADRLSPPGTRSGGNGPAEKT